MEEQAALVDESGRVVGSAPRSVMRRDNLRHAATGILVTNGAGQVHVHRRTDTKDVYPGFLDFAAGGVLAYGEEPLASATRELAEELGITGVPLEFLGEADYRDERVDLHAWLYRVTWDGPVRHQPEEVAWGRWMEVAELRAMVADPAVDVMPDSVAIWSALESDDLLAGLAGMPTPDGAPQP